MDRLELIGTEPDKIEIPVVQVQYNSFMDHYHFRVHYALASPKMPLNYLPNRNRYEGMGTPNISFNLDPNFSQKPAQELPHSSVWSGVGLGQGAYQRAKATVYSEKGIIVLNRFNRAQVVGELDEQAVQEVVEALAGNHLQPPNWTQPQSAFKFDDRDKPLLVNFMVRQLAPYLRK